MQRGLAIAAVGCLLGAAIAGALAAGPSYPRDARSGGRKADLASLARAIPAYRDTPWFPLGAQIELDGTPRHMAYAVTQDPAEKVGGYYEAVWTARGYDVRRTSPPRTRETWVTASSAQEPLLRTVGAVPGDRQTTIVASLSRVLQEPKAPRIPIPPACRLVSHVGAIDENEQTEAALVTCPGQIQELVAYYRQSFPQQRVTSQPSRGPDGQSVLLRLGQTGSELTVVAQSVEGERKQVVGTLVWREQK